MAPSRGVMKLLSLQAILAYVIFEIRSRSLNVKIDLQISRSCTVNAL